MRSHSRTFIAIILLASLASVVGSAPWAGAATGGSAPEGPNSGTWFGAYVGLRRGLSQSESIAQLQGEIGRTFKLVNRFHAFTDHNYSVEAWMISQGILPMISWRGTNSGIDPNRASEIARGRWDSVIAATADAVKALGNPVLIRFNWEMDQAPPNREHIGSPSAFIAAWRHIHAIFAAHQATNAFFVWAPHAGGFRTGAAQKYYPGSSYVDWIGASAVEILHWHSYHHLFEVFYSWASSLGKPLETWVGVREQPGHPTWKSRWMSATHLAVKAWPDVKAFIYYNSSSGHNYWADSDRASLAAYVAMAQDAYFHPA